MASIQPGFPVFCYQVQEFTAFHAFVVGSEPVCRGSRRRTGNPFREFRASFPTCSLLTSSFGNLYLGSVDTEGCHTPRFISKDHSENVGFQGSNRSGVEKGRQRRELSRHPAV